MRRGNSELLTSLQPSENTPPADTCYQGATKRKARRPYSRPGLCALEARVAVGGLPAITNELAACRESGLDPGTPAWPEARTAGQ